MSVGAAQSARPPTMGGVSAASLHTPLSDAALTTYELKRASSPPPNSSSSVGGILIDAGLSGLVGGLDDHTLPANAIILGQLDMDGEDLAALPLPRRHAPKSSDLHLGLEKASVNGGVSPQFLTSSAGEISLGDLGGSDDPETKIILIKDDPFPPETIIHEGGGFDPGLEMTFNPEEAILPAVPSASERIADFPSSSSAVIDLKAEPDDAGAVTTTLNDHDLEVVADDDLPVNVVTSDQVGGDQHAENSKQQVNMTDISCITVNDQGEIVIVVNDADSANSSSASGTPFAELRPGDLLHLCPANCMFYARSKSDMTRHLTLKHALNLQDEDKLVPVRFERLELTEARCTHCPRPCFQVITLMYFSGGGGGGGGNLLRKVFRQCKRCLVECTDTTDQHMLQCHLSLDDAATPTTTNHYSPTSSSSPLQHIIASPQPPLPPLPALPASNLVYSSATPHGFRQLGGAGAVSSPKKKTKKSAASAAAASASVSASNASIPRSSWMYYVCQTCGKGFNDNGSLQKHIVVTHSHDRRFKCSRHGCEYQTDEIDQWNQHYIGCTINKYK